MGFPRQESWSGWPFPSQGGLPDPGIKPASPALAGGIFTRVTWEALIMSIPHLYQFYTYVYLEAPPIELEHDLCPK